MPDVGSTFDAGHKPRGGFFLAPHPDPSPAGDEETPFVWEDVADNVAFEDAVEAREVEEFVRWAVLRGMNILNSSVDMEFTPFWVPLGVLHPVLEMGWKLGRGATAVICDEACERLPFAMMEIISKSTFLARP